jgi:hypothetical protein
MKMLSFKHNNMFIKHQDILMSFERFMPQKASEIAERDYSTRQSLPMSTQKPAKLLPRDKMRPQFSLCRQNKEIKLRTRLRDSKYFAEQPE